MGGNFKKIVTFGTQRFVRYSSYVRYLGCPLLGGFTVETLVLHLSNYLLKYLKEFDSFYGSLFNLVSLIHFKHHCQHLIIT